MGKRKTVILAPNGRSESKSEDVTGVSTVQLLWVCTMHHYILNHFYPKSKIRRRSYARRTPRFCSKSNIKVQEGVFCDPSLLTTVDRMQQHPRQSSRRRSRGWQHRYLMSQSRSCSRLTQWQRRSQSGWPSRQSQSRLQWNRWQ